MTNKELLSQVIDSYEEKTGHLVSSTFESDTESCTITISFQNKTLKTKVERQLMGTNAPIMLFDELMEAACSNIIDLMEKLGVNNKLKD